MRALQAKVIKFSRCVMRALAEEPETYLSPRVDIADRLMIRMNDRMLAGRRFDEWIKVKQSPMMSIVETLSFYESLIGLYELPGRDKGYQHRLLTSCGILVRAPMERVRCKENLGRTIHVYSAERQGKNKPSELVLEIPKEHADEPVWVVDLRPISSTAACGGAGKSERDVKAMAARADDAAAKLLEELQEEEAAASARQGKAASKNAQKKERERARQVQLKEERAKAEAERVLWEEAEASRFPAIVCPYLRVLCVHLQPHSVAYNHLLTTIGEAGEGTQAAREGGGEGSDQGGAGVLAQEEGCQASRHGAWQGAEGARRAREERGVYHLPVRGCDPLRAALPPCGVLRGVCEDAGGEGRGPMPRLQRAAGGQCTLVPHRPAPGQRVAAFPIGRVCLRLAPFLHV